MASANLLHPVRRYFVMPGCDGDDLRRWLQEGGWMCLYPWRGGVVLKWKVVPLWEESLTWAAFLSLGRIPDMHI